MEEGPSKRRVHSLNLLDHTLFFCADANSDLVKLRDVVSRTCGVSYARLSLLTVVWTTLSNLCVLLLSRSLQTPNVVSLGRKVLDDSIRDHPDTSLVCQRGCAEDSIDGESVYSEFRAAMLLSFFSSFERLPLRLVALHTVA